MDGENEKRAELRRGGDYDAIGGMAAATPQEPTSIDRLLKEVSDVADRTYQAARRAKTLADRLEGAHPEAVETSAEDAASPNGAIDAIGRSLERQITNLTNLETSISRLERLI